MTDWPEIEARMTTYVETRDLRGMTSLMAGLGLQRLDPIVVEMRFKKVLRHQPQDIRDFWLHEVCTCGPENN